MIKYLRLTTKIKAKEYNILELNTGKSVVAESIIPLEKIKDHTLMLSVARDGNIQRGEAGFAKNVLGNLIWKKYNGALLRQGVSFLLEE